MSDETQFIDLVLDTGDLVRVEVAMDEYDQVVDAMDAAMKRRDWWTAEGADYEARMAYFNGLDLDRVNMARVVGRL